MAVVSEITEPSAGFKLKWTLRFLVADAYQFKVNDVKSNVSSSSLKLKLKLVSEQLR